MKLFPLIYFNFDIFRDKLDIDIQYQTAVSASTFGKDKELPVKKDPPICVIDQSDMNNQIFANVQNCEMLGKVNFISHVLTQSC